MRICDVEIKPFDDQDLQLRASLNILLRNDDIFPVALQNSFNTISIFQSHMDARHRPNTVLD